MWRGTVRFRATSFSEAPVPCRFRCFERSMNNPLQFIQDVRGEADKVTWPNRRETVITTVLVVLMCVFASLFLFGVDQAIHLAITSILTIGR